MCEVQHTQLVASSLLAAIIVYHNCVGSVASIYDDSAYEGITVA